MQGRPFPMGLLPSSFLQGLFLSLSLNWNVHSYKLTLYRLGCLSVFAITSTLCCAEYPFHSAQQPPRVYQDVLPSRDRQKEWTAVREICSACVSYPKREGDEVCSLLGLPSDFPFSPPMPCYCSYCMCYKNIKNPVKRANKHPISWFWPHLSSPNVKLLPW